MTKEDKKKMIIAILDELVNGVKDLMVAATGLKVAIIKEGTREPDPELFQVYKETRQSLLEEAKKDNSPLFELLYILDTKIAEIAAEWPLDFILETMDTKPVFSRVLQDRIEREKKTFSLA